MESQHIHVAEWLNSHLKSVNHQGKMRNTDLNQLLRRGFYVLRFDDPPPVAMRLAKETLIKRQVITEETHGGTTWLITPQEMEFTPRVIGKKLTLPFDYEKAKAGHPLTTQDGYEVTGARFCETGIYVDVRVPGVLPEVDCEWYQNNGQTAKAAHHGYDLLLLVGDAPAESTAPFVKVSATINNTEGKMIDLLGEAPAAGLTARKAAWTIQAEAGRQLTGFVISNPDGSVTLVDRSACRRLTKAEFQDLMHPTQQQPVFSKP